MYGNNNIIQSFIKLLKVIATIGKDFGLRFLLVNFKSTPKRFKNALFNKTPFISRPLVIGIGVCNDCNINCVYCFDHSLSQVDATNAAKNGRDALKKNMDIRLLRKVIDDLSILGVSLVRFAGRGEPFLHPQFMEMCRYVKTKSLHFDVTSNGTLITDEMAQEMVDMGVERLDISIGADSPSTYHRLTNSPPENLEKIFKMLKRMMAYRRRKGAKKPRVMITNVICRLNFREIVDMVRKGVELGVDSVGAHKMYFCARRLKLVEDLLLNEDEVQNLRGLLVEAAVIAKENALSTNLAFFLKLLSREGVRKTVDYRPSSKYVKSGGMVLADGAFFPADYPEIVGNVNKDSVIKIWHSSRYRLIRNSAEALGQSRALLPCVSFCRCCDKPLYETSGWKDD